MQQDGTSESTSYFAFVVIIIFGLFLYAGVRLTAPKEAPDPAPPLLTANGQSPGGGLTLLPEDSGAAGESKAADPAGNGGNNPARPAAIAPPAAAVETASYSPTGNRLNQNYLAPSRASAPVYIVRPNDTLTGIAQNLLGSANRWREIARLNAEILPDPNRLKPGMRIYLPTRRAGETPSARAEKLYVVKENDSLYSLAVRFYKSPYAVAIIREANRDALAGKTDLLPGMELRLPATAARGAGASRRTYVVKPGDVLSEIARRFYNDSSQWRQIVRANPTVITDEKQLKVGAVLIIP